MLLGGPLDFNRNEARNQVVQNLADNALRHGGGTCTVAARRVGDRVEVVVSDRGPGIPASERERVLQRFHRLDDARGAGGSGLGLAIVTEIVELHDGAIQISDHPPHGCRVVVSLPAREAERP